MQPPNTTAARPAAHDPTTTDDVTPGTAVTPSPTADVRARMIAGLADVIDRVGYGPSRVRDIARAARTSLTTFYLAYPSKDDCLLELAAQLQRDVEEWLLDASSREYDSSPAAIEIAARDGLTAALRRPRLAYAMLVELGANAGPPRGARQSALAALASA
ncbi:MAG: TetR/AcrR family transcriptional regulator, partial [Myxococcales bacterium]